MIYEVIYLLQADIDIQSAFERYEDIQEGRGAEFLRSLEEASLLLGQFPNLGSPFRRPYRRLLIKEFPYGIFYSVAGSRIVIVAIQDLRRDPDSIAKLFM